MCCMVSINPLDSVCVFSMKKKLIALCIFLLGTPVNTLYARNFDECGDVIVDAGGYGPYDYTDPRHNGEDLDRVEKHHFTKDVRSLVRGSTNVTPHKDLDYTLRKFPNHHLALFAMAKLQRKEATYNYSEIYSINCYFKRAEGFAPKDSIVRLLWAIHLHKTRKYKEAEQKYLSALELNPTNAEIHYNLALMYVEMKQTSKAVVHAKEAYKLGYPLQGLKRTLKLN